MTVGTTYLVRSATTTNVIGHTYSLNTAPTPDEESYGDTRFFDSIDMSTWDETSSTTLTGTTADGSITRTDTLVVGDPYEPPG